MQQRKNQKLSAKAVCAGLMLGLAAGFSGCSQGGAGGPAGEPPPVQVLIGVPKVIRVEETLTAVGTVGANESVELRAEAAGRIDKILFLEGQRVQAGDRLFELECRTEEALVAQARAEEQLARANLERGQTLAGTRAISQQELDRLASELAVRSAILRVQEAQWADHRVDAPFAGIVGPRRVSPGQYVDAGATLGTLVDDATLKIRCGVAEGELARARPGQEARLRVNAYPDRVFPARVELINPVVDETTRTGEVRLLAANPEGLLRPGMFARVEIVVDTREDALVIPEETLVASLDAFSVFVVEEGRARLQAVQIGTRLPGQVEVRSGLAPGEEIVLSGTQKVLDGMRVTNSL